MRKNLMLVVLFSPMFAAALSAESGRHPVGIASGGDTFMVANTNAMNGATVFSGDSIQAGNTSCQIKMMNGNQIKLAPHTSAQLYENRIFLQHGTAETTLRQGAKIETQGFSVKPLTDKTHADLQATSGSMTIALLSGQAEVSNLHGVVLSHMMPGASLNFANTETGAQGASEAPSTGSQIRLVGVLDMQDKHYLIRDRFTNTVTELVGDIPSKLLNELTLADGTLDPQSPDVPHADRVIRITNIKRSDIASGLPCLPDGTGGVAKRITLKGTLSKDGDHYLVSDNHNGTYEVIGDVDQSQVGKQIDLKGFILPGRKGFAPAEQVVYAERRKLVASESPCVGAITTGVLITGAFLAVQDWGGGAPHSPVSF